MDWTPPSALTKLIIESSYKLASTEILTHEGTPYFLFYSVDILYANISLMKLIISVKSTASVIEIREYVANK